MEKEILEILRSVHLYLEDTSQQMRIKRIVHLAEGKMILDVGCSVGFISTMIRREKGERIVVGIDIDLEALKIAKGIDRKLNLILCDAHHLPLKSESFDCAVLGEVVEHVKNPYELLKSIREKLKNKGKLVLSTFNGLRITRIFLAATRKIKPLCRYHWYELDPFTLLSIIQRTGFDIIKMEGTGFPVPALIRTRSTLFARLFPFLSPFIIVKAINRS